jgi:hypothetical protein
LTQLEGSPREPVPPIELRGREPLSQKATTEPPEGRPELVAQSYKRHEALEELDADDEEAGAVRRS